MSRIYLFVVQEDRTSECLYFSRDVLEGYVALSRRLDLSFRHVRVPSWLTRADDELWGIAIEDHDFWIAEAFKTEQFVQHIALSMPSNEVGRNITVSASTVIVAEPRDVWSAFQSRPQNSRCRYWDFARERVYEDDLWTAKKVIARASPQRVIRGGLIEAFIARRNGVSALKYMHRSTHRQ